MGFLFPVHGLLSAVDDLLRLLGMLARHDCLLLLRRGVGARRFAWMSRFRRVARDDERWPEPLAGLHLLAFVMLISHRFAFLAAHASKIHKNSRVPDSI